MMITLRKLAQARGRNNLAALGMSRYAQMIFPLNPSSATVLAVANKFQGNAAQALTEAPNPLGAMFNGHSRPVHLQEIYPDYSRKEAFVGFRIEGKVIEDAFKKWLEITAQGQQIATKYQQGDLLAVQVYSAFFAVSSGISPYAQQSRYPFCPTHAGALMLMTPPEGAQVKIGNGGAYQIEGPKSATIHTALVFGHVPKDGDLMDRREHQVTRSEYGRDEDEEHLRMTIMLLAMMRLHGLKLMLEANGYRVERSAGIFAALNKFYDANQLYCDAAKRQEALSMVAKEVINDANIFELAQIRQSSFDILSPQARSDAKKIYSGVKDLCQQINSYKRDQKARPAKLTMG